MSPRYLPWDVAWHHALYGPNGFYRTGSAPSSHFRTSAHAGGVLAGALARLARRGLERVVDVGSGGGELLRALAAADPGLELVGLDVVGPPDGLPAGARWCRSPGGADLPLDQLWWAGSLVVAHEWLDDVACPVVQRDDDGAWRAVQVDVRTGCERLAGQPPAEDLAWLARWWDDPDAEPGDRAEVGRPRDQAWAGLVAAAPASLLLAVDYDHLRGDRPRAGTLIGYRDGAACPRAASPLRSAACSRTVSSRRPHRYPGSRRLLSSMKASRIALRPRTVGPCSASPVQRWFGASASNRPNACGSNPQGRVFRSRRTKWRCSVRSSGEPPRMRPQDRRDLHRRPLGDFLLQRHRQPEHVGRRACRHLRRGGDQCVEPAATPVPQPPIQRGPRDTHRRPERPLVLPRAPVRPAPVLRHG